MGIVKVVGELGLEPEDSTEVEFMVDTGSLYTFVGPGLAVRLGLDFPVTSDIVLANNTRMQVPPGSSLSADARQGRRNTGRLLWRFPCRCWVSPALEILGFKVNPVAQTIEYDRPFGPCAL